MGFLDVVGELFGFGGKTWKMTVLDSASSLSGKTFEGQFIATDMQETVGSFLGESTTANKDVPNFQWVRGEANTFSFTSRIFATDSLINIQPQIALLKSLAKRDVKLKRAPKIRFEAGTEIALICLIRGVRFRYDELRSDGSLRGAVIEIQLQELDEKATLPEAASDIAKFIKLGIGVIVGAAGINNQIRRKIDLPGGSVHTLGTDRIAKQGDTFELIAAQEYGNALAGDILRRVQPEIADLQPGDKVILIEPLEIPTIRVTPQSVALRDTPENLELREIKLAARNRPTTIFV